VDESVIIGVYDSLEAAKKFLDIQPIRSAPLLSDYEYEITEWKMNLGS
jgi:hypothetical protein